MKKSQALQNWMILLFLFFSIPVSLRGIECQVTLKIDDTASIDGSKLKEEIRSWLINHSCSPVLTNEDLQYEIDRVFEYSGAIYTLGELKQGKNSAQALFSMSKGWFSYNTNLLYISTDALPDLQLFSDISFAVQAALPNELGKYHVFIKKLENPPNGRHFQVWTFFNSIEWIEVLVLTVPTPDGGVDFMVKVFN